MKSRIIARLQDKMPGHTTKEQAEEALAHVVEAIAFVTTQDGEARVPGFGTFKKRRREGRTVKVPTTGEMVTTTGKDVITFKQSKTAQ